MAKRHLSDKQKQQIQSQQDQHLQDSQHGLVVAHYGDSIDVEADDGTLFNCNIRQSLPPIVVGDQVAWAVDETQPQTGVVLALEPRHSEMTRRNQRGDTKLIAANIDQVLIVVAAEPTRSEQILDRYLVMTQLQNLPSVIVFNKCDLLNAEELAEKQAYYKEYQRLGYPAIFFSNQTKQGWDQLADILKNKNSVFVGLSGVGKSSLIKALLPEQEIKIGAMIEGGKIGKHTTSTARLYHLITGGNVIDSPGIREFSMEGLSQREIEQGFREFAPYLTHCKFRDCKHIYEPDCAIHRAVEDGKISSQRWEAYKQILS